MADPDKYMKLKQPCKDCPFVVANQFPLGLERRREIGKSLLAGETFSCHKTINYDNEGLPDTTSSARCFGAASVLYKSRRPPMQVEQIAVRLGIARPPTERQLCNPKTYDNLNAFMEDDR